MASCLCAGASLEFQKLQQLVAPLLLWLAGTTVAGEPPARPQATKPVLLADNLARSSPGPLSPRTSPGVMTTGVVVEGTVGEVVGMVAEEGTEEVAEGTAAAGAAAERSGRCRTSLLTPPSWATSP